MVKSYRNIIFQLSCLLFSVVCFAQKNTTGFNTKLTQLPATFQKNEGRWNTAIQYKATAPGWNASVSFLKNEISYGFSKKAETRDLSFEEISDLFVWNMQFLNANADVRITATDETTTNTNYLIGNNPSKYIIGAKHYGKIKYENLYDGVNVSYYLNNNRLKYDYQIERGVDVNVIKIALKGIEKIAINKKQQLEITTSWGILIEELPESYQLINGVKKNVAVLYRILNDTTFGFVATGKYDRNYDLIIDPVILEWGTYIANSINGADSYCHDMTVDAQGNIYGVGRSWDLNFPVTPGAYKTTIDTLGISQSSCEDKPDYTYDDVVVFKLNPTGSALLYCTYIGGFCKDRGRGIAVNNAGEVTITGHTVSADYPTLNAHQTIIGTAREDAFVTKLNATGTGLIFSTFMGGLGLDVGEKIDVDAAGNQYVVGFSAAALSDFPTTAGAYQTTYNGGFLDGFFAKFNPTGTLIYASYLGGAQNEECLDLEVNAAGEMIIVGVTNSAAFPTTVGAYSQTITGNHDLFITKINNTGTGLVFSTLIGGSSEEATNMANLYPGGIASISINYGLPKAAIKINTSEEIFVTSRTMSANFPTTAGVYDNSWNTASSIVVFKMNTNASNLLYSTFLGSGESTGIDVNTKNEVFICGTTRVSQSYPTTTCSFDNSLNSTGNSSYEGGDHFLSKLSADFSTLKYSTLIGGDGISYYTPRIRVLGTSCDERILLSGTTHATNYPTTPGTVWFTPPTGAGIYFDRMVVTQFKPKLNPGFTAVTSCLNVTFTDTTSDCGNWGDTLTKRTWHFGDGTTATGKVVTHTYANAASYTAKLVVGCPNDSVSKTFSLINDLSLTAYNYNQACAVGNTGAIKILATGTGTFSYLWNNAQTTDSIFNLAQGGYTVTVTSSSGCSKTTSVTLTAPALLSVTASATQTACGVSTGTATVTSTNGGSGAYEYLWSNSQTGTTATALGVGIYTLVVTDENSCTATTTVNVTNQSGPTAIISATTIPNCFAGNNGSAEVTVTGSSGNLTYSWTSTPPVTTTATVNLINGLAAGSYTVTVVDGSGCNAITSVTLTQPTKLNALATGLNTTCANSCTGQLIVVPSNGTGTAPYSVLWSNGNTGLSINNICAANYSVIVTDAKGCTKDTVVTVNEAAPITVTANTSPANCNQTNGSATVSANGGAGSFVYTWSNNILTNNNNNIGSGNYCVTITDLLQCAKDTCIVVPTANGVTATISASAAPSCFNDCDGTVTASAAGSSGYVYTWSNNQATAAITGLCTGGYTVTIRDVNNCTSVASASITAPDVITTQVVQPASICVGASVNLSATASGGDSNYTYTWLPSGPTVSPLTTTTYTVQVSDSKGCTATSQTVTVSVSPPLNITAGLGVDVCSGQSASITATANGGDGNYNYTWQPGAINNATISITPTANQTYTVTVNDGCGSLQVQTTVTATINPSPVIAIASTINTACVGTCIDFQDNSTIAVGTIISRNWSTAGLISNQTTPSFCYSSAGNYSVVLSAQSDKGCISTDSVSGMITIHPLPTAAFTFTPSNPTILNPELIFTDQSINPFTWLWNFGDVLDNSPSSLQNPKHLYADTGRYCIKLSITDINGCVDTTTNCVVIEPEFAMYIPNAFSPNQDGINESFLPKAIGVKTFKMIIFDRWGALIFKSESLLKGWDGRANNGTDIAQQDVYVYVVTAVDVFNKQHNYIGHVTLVK